MVQVKISQDITKYEAKTFFGFSPRQIMFTGLAIIIGLFINFGMKVLPQDLRGMLTMVCAAPLIGCGWIQKQGMHFEKYMFLFFKQNFTTRKRVFMNEDLFYYININNKSKKVR